MLTPERTRRARRGAVADVSQLLESIDFTMEDKINEIESCGNHNHKDIHDISEVVLCVRHRRGAVADLRPLLHQLGLLLPQSAYRQAQHEHEHEQVPDHVPQPPHNAAPPEFYALLSVPREACEYASANVDALTFDIFHLDELSNGCALPVIMFTCLDKLGVLERCGINLEQFAGFTRRLQDGYNPNPYHSAVHAADVIQGTYWLLASGGLVEKINMSPQESLAIILAAAIHDYDHPGFDNKFVSDAKIEPAASRYNESVLERHAIDCGLDLIDRCGSLENLPTKDQDRIRHLIETATLKTDISNFRGHLNEFSEASSSTVDGMRTSERDIIICMALQCADVSNPARPFHLYKRWTEGIMAEWSIQGQQQRTLGLEPSSKFHCEGNSDPEVVAECQRGFVNFVVLPLFQAWSDFLPNTEPMLQQLAANLAQFQRVTPILQSVTC